jgi:phosphoribosylanthranilate isomerase
MRVGVLVNAAPERMLELVRELGLDAVQLHGAESVDVVRGLSTVVNVWKAVRVRSASDVQRALELYGPFVSALLLDGYDPAQAGGGGKSFAWDAIVPVRAGWPPSPALVLAGGLAPDNVARAVGLLAPDIVDVSSGVEEAVGRKSAERVAAFVAAARGAITAERST